MSTKVIKLILVTNEDTAGMIMDYADLPLKAREDPANETVFIFLDKNHLEHPFYFVHAEVI